ncbi:hypothetical protein MA16_Dca025167 [Dendrobium catenatum]|uniref:RNase H type-1 domain-containing protein n=1 Tax=Dendrobium catenatum TaxID=906689 RepID=A0A2I0VIC5_9ASPA|nr:hypothetical protein MA16_Dca025167 [Dendrobium catenatum]
MFSSLEELKVALRNGLKAKARWPMIYCCLKINVDGALHRTNADGIGIVIWNSCSKLVVVAGWSITHWDSTQVKVMVVHYIEQLLLDCMYEVDGVIIEGDNTSVMEFMHKCKQQEWWRLRSKEGDKLDWLKLFQKVLFVHTYREYNKVAHFCAQRAIEGSFVWETGDNHNICIPQDFLSILEDDSSSLALD